MEQKIVSFKVAEALKEAGYPQYRHDVGYVTEKCCDGFNVFNKGRLTDNASRRVKKISAPTYLEVWLWLWREKKIYFAPRLIQKDPTIGDYTWLISPWDMGYINKTSTYSFHNNDEENPYKIMDDVEDPEKAIAAAIEYLVEHNWIK